MLAILAESALRSFLLGSIVWVGLNLLRMQNPHVQMTSWAMVLIASLSMPLLIHWMTVTITLEPSAVPTPEKLWPSGIPLPEPLSSSIPSDLRNPQHGRWRKRSSHQLVGRRGGNLFIGLCCAVAEDSARRLSDLAACACRKADKRTLGCQLERACEQCHRRPRHFWVDNSPTSAMHGVGSAEASGRARP